MAGLKCLSIWHDPLGRNFDRQTTPFIRQELKKGNYKQKLQSCQGWNPTFQGSDRNQFQLNRRGKSGQSHCLRGDRFIINQGRSWPRASIILLFKLWHYMEFDIEEKVIQIFGALLGNE